MSVQEVQELLTELTATEQLELARWLIDTALTKDNSIQPINEQVSSDKSEEDGTESDRPANGFNQHHPSQKSHDSNASTIQHEDDVVREKQAYQSMHQILWSQYPKEHVAIYNGQLVDHDKDGIALSRRVYGQYPNEFVLIRKVEPQSERTLHFRSPRFT